jgi:hypothetical protein
VDHKVAARQLYASKTGWQEYASGRKKTEGRIRNDPAFFLPAVTLAITQVRFTDAWVSAKAALRFS